jgi:hypothetical protein
VTSVLRFKAESNVDTDYGFNVLYRTPKMSETEWKMV